MFSDTNIYTYVFKNQIVIIFYNLKYKLVDNYLLKITKSFIAHFALLICIDMLIGIRFLIYKIHFKIISDFLN